MPSTMETAVRLGAPVPSSQAPLGASALEFITKMSALLVVGSYAVGYLIVVINDNAHGFLETSLIRPRAITAGAVFILVTALPISLTQGTFFGKGSDEPESKLQTSARWLLGIVDYACACSITGLVMFFFFIDKAGSQSLSRNGSGTLLALIYVVSTNAIVRSKGVTGYRKRPIGWLVFCVLSLAILPFAIYMLRGSTVMRCLAWAFAVTAVVNPYVSDIRRGVLLRPKIIPFMVMPLLAVSIYAVNLFPLMKATWGGGAPISTTIYLSKDSPIHPNIFPDRR